MSSVKFTAAIDNRTQAIYPGQVVSVRLTRGDPNTSSGPQGTLIVTTAAPPHHEIVVVEGLDVVLETLDSAMRVVVKF